MYHAGLLGVRVQIADQAQHVRIVKLRLAERLQGLQGLLALAAASLRHGVVKLAELSVESL